MGKPRAPCERRSHVHTLVGLQDRSVYKAVRFGSVQLAKADPRSNGLAKHRFAAEPQTWHMNHARQSPVLGLSSQWSKWYENENEMGGEAWPSGRM